MNTNLNINNRADAGTETLDAAQAKSLCFSGNNNTIGLTLSPG